MDERRSGSKRAFIVSWLLTLAFVLAVGPFGSPGRTVECDGADCVDGSVETRARTGADSRERKQRVRARIEMRQNRVEQLERKERPRVKAAGPNDRLRVQEWRGKAPQICFVKGCENGNPTFCVAARNLPIAPNGLKIPKHRDPCAMEPRFRTARTRV